MLRHGTLRLPRGVPQHRLLRTLHRRSSNTSINSATASIASINSTVSQPPVWTSRTFEHGLDMYPVDFNELSVVAVAKPNLEAKRLEREGNAYASRQWQLQRIRKWVIEAARCYASGYHFTKPNQIRVDLPSTEITDEECVHYAVKELRATDFYDVELSFSTDHKYPQIVITLPDKPSQP